MILTHGANSLASGGTPIPSGYEQLWGIGGFTSNSNDIRFLPGYDGTPPSLAGKTNADIVTQMTVTSVPEAFANNATFFLLGVNGKSRIRLYLGADENGYYTAIANNDYWTDTIPSGISLGSSYPTSSSFTFVLTTYRNTLNVSVSNDSFDYTNVPYVARTDQVGAFSINASPNWQGRPFCFNELKVTDHASGNVLLHIIPLKKLSDDSVWCWDAINDTFSTSDGLIGYATNPYA